MIIHGINSVHLKTVHSRNGICPNCNSKGELSINIYRKHAHVFWIPMFPLWKVGNSECNHCKKVIRYKEMPENVKLEYYNVKVNTKGPIWQFSGLAIIFVLIFGLTAMSEISGESYRKKQLEIISFPMKGDVYEYVINTRRYTTLKIVDVFIDSIYFSPNIYETKSILKLYKIDKQENYSNEIYSISKETVKEMYTTGEIIGVKRE